MKISPAEMLLQSLLQEIRQTLKLTERQAPSTVYRGTLERLGEKIDRHLNDKRTISFEAIKREYENSLREEAYENDPR